MTRPEAPAAPAEGRAAPPLAIPLRAGPLRLVFDRGWLRWVRLGEREVLHGIYAAVRETGWATVPGRVEDLDRYGGRAIQRDINCRGCGKRIRHEVAKNERRRPGRVLDPGRGPTNSLRVNDPIVSVGAP